MRRLAVALAVVLIVPAGLALAQQPTDVDADGVAGDATPPQTVPASRGGDGSEGVLAGTLIAVTWSTADSAVGSIDTVTGTWTAVGNTGQTRLNGLARDTAEVFYSVAWDGATTSWLITVDPGTGAATVGATLNPFIDVRGLAFSDTDTLYAIANESSGDLLYTIDTTTGAATLVGSTGYFTVQGLAFSPANGTLYAWDNSAGLLTVDTATGLASDVNPGVGGTGDIQTVSALPDGSMYGVRYDLYAINPADGSYSLVAVGGYPDVRGADFTGPYPVDLQSFTID